MKKIINGKKYDTETASFIANWWNGFATNDFHYLKETLYQKKNGEWFLLGEGGAMTRYCINSGDSRCGGSNIIPLTENEAKKWVEIHHNDDYEQLFGEVEE